ncbi:hypothetical protein FDUTEX481_01589 [Tolypothrix sp. PCC 7601]|nr:hypothetical protein FDUTEX481_01589 [Tolypothrix sp. PCC 7601]
MLTQNYLCHYVGPWRSRRLYAPLAMTNIYLILHEYLLGNTVHTKSNNVCNTSIYSRGQGSALPLQSVAFFFQIGIS